MKIKSDNVTIYSLFTIVTLLSVAISGCVNSSDDKIDDSDSYRDTESDNGRVVDPDTSPVVDPDSEYIADSDTDDSADSDTDDSTDADTDDSADSDSGSEIDADSDSDSGDDPDLGFDCSTGEAKLVVDFAVDSSAGLLPWIVWPHQSDGSGNLIVSVSLNAGPFDRVENPDANLAPVGATHRDTRCMTPGPIKLNAFLDDNNDAAANDTTSSDYRDTCLGQTGSCFRCVNASLTAGEVTHINAVLVGTCD